MKKSNKCIWIFCLLAFVPVWAVCAALLIWGTSNAVLMTLLFAGFMFMPAIASILTRLICKEGFANMGIRPQFRGNIGRYALAWFLPTVMVAVGAALYLLTQPALFTMENLQGEQAGAVVTSIVVGVLLGPLLNLIPAFGEELGWRGYLLPRLAERMPVRAAALVSGAIWGLWHAPMIALGHNYGFGYAGYPWLGILLMTLFCIFFGLFSSWLTIKTGSAIPAALAHAGLNAVAGLGAVFCLPSYNPIIGPMPMGLVGGIPVLIAGVCFFVTLKKKQS